MKTKKYSVEWKYKEQKKNGGWAQRHENEWRWHSIRCGTEYSTAGYLTKKDCEKTNSAKSAERNGQ